MRDFSAQAAALRSEMIARRRDLHQHPEIAFEEVRTSGIVAAALGELGLEVQTGLGKTGVVGILEGTSDGPTILVRCDMDALPIQEEADPAYRSQIPQRMHACGHDAHTTIALGVAKLLSAEREKIKGRIKFVFQPAEEIGQGAAAMIADGVLTNPAPEICLGLHVWPELPVGEIVANPGPTMAGAALLVIELEGRGGHAARPSETIDPVIAAAHLATALQSIVSRNINPNDAAIVSITQISAGDAHNVIPNRAILRGTFRTFTPTAQTRVKTRLREITEGVAAAFNCTAKLEIIEAVPPLVNDPAVVERMKAGWNAIRPEIVIRDGVRVMEAEDMGIYLQHMPGLYFFVGCGGKYPLHHPHFDLDEETLVVGASLLASAVSDYVL